MIQLPMRVPRLAHSRLTIGLAAAGLAIAIAGVAIAGAATLASTGPAAGEAGSATLSATSGQAANSIATDGSTAASAVRAASNSVRQPVPVRVGSITDTIGLDGRIAGADESPLAFRATGLVTSVQATVGQAVDVGQTLAELDPTTIQQNLTAARTRLDENTVRLQQAQAQARLRERDLRARLQAQVDQTDATLRQALADRERVQAGPPASDRQQAESAVAAAQADVRRAEAELARLRSGPAQADIRFAQQQVASAQLAAQRAEAAQQQLLAGPDPNAVRAAEQQVAQAQVTVQRAEAEQQRLAAGPDQAAVRAAERDFTNAQAAVTRAQAEVQRLTTPDNAALASADLEVKRAEVTLRAAKAQSSSSRDSKDNKAARASQQAAVTSAQISLQDAIARRDRLRAGPPAWEANVARQNLAVAQSALQDARANVEKARQAPPQTDVDAAKVAANAARIDLEEAQTKLAALKAGPSDDQRASAQDAVDSTHAALETAQARYATLTAGPASDQVALATSGVTSARLAMGVASTRLDELRSHPTEQELSDAQAAVDAATAAAEQARSDAANPPTGDDDPATYDLRLLEKAVAQAQTQVDVLEQQLTDTHLTAPFRGVVAQIRVTPGSTVDPSFPAVVLAQPDQPIVLATLSDSDGSRVTAGQTATVSIGDGPPLSAQVADIANGPAPGTQFARLNVVWDALTPVIGSPTQVSIITQQHDRALIVPQKAIRSAGPRRYVEVVDGAATRMSTVTEGIAANGDVEILSGVSEGQQVIVGP
ncbi:MAG: HlyD family efflux transporter periplasmic adaptor subunit [Chloroflexi bacterium]|nr:HlyD family efflux transporter periplasmic adaptor subunit [Chloroflexota bacterium]